MIIIKIMGRRILLALLVALIINPLSALSIVGENIENPFPSVENLESYDFKSQEISFPELEINLISTETADPVYSYFGHTSLEVVVPDYPRVFYDYGYFAFSDGFYLNFIMGRLLYNCYPSDGEMRLDYFELEDRTVHRTPLKSLSIQEKNAMFSFLNFNMRRENNTYLYDYYFDNCATRVRDIYNEATGGEFKAWAESIKTGRTLREAANVHLDKAPIVSFTLNFLEGPSIDKSANLYEECFLPMRLMDAIEEFEGLESEIVHTSSYRVNERTHSLNFYSIITAIVIFFISLALYSSRFKVFRRLADLLHGVIYIYLFVLSSVLLFMMTATNHSVTYLNANILYSNPIIIIMTLEAFRGRKVNKRFYYSVTEIIIITVGIIFKGIFPTFFIQENLAIIAILLSLYLSNVVNYIYTMERIERGEKEKETPASPISPASNRLSSLLKGTIAL